MKSDIRAKLFGQEAAVNSLVDKGKRDGEALSSFFQEVINDPFFLTYWRLNKGNFLTYPQILEALGIPVIPWGYANASCSPSETDDSILGKFLRKYLENKDYFHTYTGDKMEELFSACDFLMSRQNSERLPNFISHGVHIIIEPSLSARNIMGGQVRWDGINVDDDKRFKELPTGGVEIKFFIPYPECLAPFNYPLRIDFREANITEALTTILAWFSISSNFALYKDRFFPKHLQNRFCPGINDSFQIKTKEGLVVSHIFKGHETIVSKEGREGIPTYLLAVR